LRPAATTPASRCEPDDLRLVVEGRAGSGSRAADALRHPTLPDLWHTVWADDGQPGGQPPGVTVRLTPDATGAVQLMIIAGDAEHPWSLRLAARLGGLRAGRWVVALPTPERARPRLAGLTLDAARDRPAVDLLLLRVESGAPTIHDA
jgi:hypothetical protein